MKKKTIWITGAAVATVLVVGGAGLAIADPFDGSFGNDGPLTGDTLDRASTAALDAVGSGTVTDSDLGDDDDAQAYEIEITLADGTDVDVALDDTFGVLWVDGMPRDGATTGTDSDNSTGTGTGTDDSNTGSNSDDDNSGTDAALPALTETDREAASAAALAALPAGTVGTITEVERSDDFDHAYEVEVTLENGQDIDVELDEAFAVVTVDGVPAA